LKLHFKRFKKNQSSCNMASASTKAQELELDIGELRQFLETAKRQKVKDIVGISIRKLETELIELRNQEKREENTATKTGDHTTANVAVKKIPEVQIKDYSYDQSDKFVKLYLTGVNGADKLDKDNIKVTFTDQSLSVRIENINNKNLNFAINKTCHKISPDKSYFKAKSDYVLVCLAKHNPGSKWSHMTYAEKAAADAKKVEDAPKVDDPDDPSAGLMKMMKKMYEEGDDEMKRTIAKAWTEGQEKRGAGGMQGGMPDF